MRSRWPTRVGCLYLAALCACSPSTVAEAEARGDVAWLQQNDSPDAVAALGRLADKNEAAVAALKTRSEYDVGSFRAAWTGILRGSAWATAMMRDGLADPKRANRAASGMGKHDSHLLPFLPDLENALVRLSASTQNVNISSTLASIGPPARAAIERRLLDATTRGGMCTGIAADVADIDARKALIEVPEKARDAPACVDAAVHIAADDEPTLIWIAERAEPGILGAAGKSDALACVRLHVAWARAFAARPPTVYPALIVPLGYAITRCASEMDGVLADAIVHVPAAHNVVVEAIDPFTSYSGALHATCAALPAVASGQDTAVVRERATDALMHTCKAPG